MTRTAVLAPGPSGVAGQGTLVDQVHDGLARGEFFLTYQPVVDGQTGALEGFEALVRWAHPRHGVVTPSRFVPALEELGALEDLTAHVLSAASAAAARWPTIDGRALRVRVNLPAGMLADPRLPLWVLRTLRHAGLAPSRLVLEVTERAVLEAPHVAGDVCRWLRSAGIAIALDDFTAGPQDYRRLEVLTVDEIKTDHDLLASQAPGASGELAGLLAMAANQGVTATVEGVGTREQLDMAVALGAPRVQGHLLAPPRRLGPVDVYLLSRRGRVLIQAALSRRDARLAALLEHPVMADRAFGQAPTGGA